MVWSAKANMEEPVYDPTLPLPSREFLYKHQLVNTPDKSILALKVTFPPSGSTPPHTHAGAFVAGTVLSGTALNKVNDDPMEIKNAGESFFEHPTCRHRISANASKTEEMTLFVTMVLETEKLERILKEEGPSGLTVIDEEWREAVKEQIELRRKKKL